MNDVKRTIESVIKAPRLREFEETPRVFYPQATVPQRPRPEYHATSRPRTTHGIMSWTPEHQSKQINEFSKLKRKKLI